MGKALTPRIASQRSRHSERSRALLPTHPRWWGTNERGLQPPVWLLEWLVRNISVEAVVRSRDSDETLGRRQALASRDPATLNGALGFLRAGERGRKWFVLEGESLPDALLETDRLVLVVEGKRTERMTTTKTT